MASGGCACGAVRYEVVGPLRDVFNCHCERCRRFTGHHMAATAAAPGDVHVAGEPLKWWEAAPGVEYGFCSQCGSSLFWRAAVHPEKLSICAGSVDQPTGLRTTLSWWTAEAADYHVRPPGIQEFDYES